MIPQEIIRRKRDGEVLSANEIAAFIRAMSEDRISEGQVAAFAMAVFFRGMTRDETIALTLAMRDSGDVLSWGDVTRPIADKHSTGGVGDNVSLMLAPIAAACGLAVPMISGRGLGHTGGTLDKLESIPGYNIMPDEKLLRRTVDEIGCAIIGQTSDLAPADRRLYAIRDVTATVESVPLITASILSKKLAAGLQTLVMDVKVGSGAFMSNLANAENLTRSLVDVAIGAGVPTSALITDMDQPLADAAGNALEIVNCVDFLKGSKAGTRLETVVLAFAAEMLVQSGAVASLSDGEQAARSALQSGRAAEVFGRMVHALGGPSDFLERSHNYLPAAPVKVFVPAVRDGYLAQCQTRALGMAVVELGGGRRRASDAIDHRVGLDGLLPLGTKVVKGQPIAFVHAANEEDAERIAGEVARLFMITDDAPAETQTVLKRIG
ncbi:thymidine phosphorylase [Rhizobiales bacterium RZME27]|jgi:thymidine phosphorylase|uniref:Thymidine phosphorylase n=1 Tax=Endobacterium cereale TaxID=2663029 RepID=A0A6A8A4Z3_9HYPH|nr:thymidine phosphorylase [Endobacterium cereale]MEB2844966.1 thymidine phosphorylase [Endobacterium cereale]MQY44878.1 thymidine phosphorylase [Endobacterium cereale]